MKLLLASKSPRRRQLLAELGFPIEFVDVDVEERVPDGTKASEVAERLACLKAAAWPVERLAPGEVLVTADTVVVHRNQVLGKPSSRDEALAMLHALSGDSHTVYTGVSLRSSTKQISFTESTEVFFRKLTDADIEYYVDHYKPFDKAGAYGIQEWIGMVGVERIEGCFYNVMGLPVARLYERLSLMSESD